jgi:hypothetical protein
MTSLTGGTVAVGGNDFFAPSLREDTDPIQAAHDAQKNLNALGDQFESGEYDGLDANAFASMDLVALSWARMGWAQFLQGDNLRSWQFLEAAWELSQSGTVANRLARIFEKTGARDRAQHMFALAVAAGGPDAESSRQQVMKLNPVNADKELSQAATELHNMRLVTLPRLVSQTAAARFALMFDNSKNPERVQFIDGDESLRAVGDKLQGTAFPVKFPDMSSIKIILMGTVSCDPSGCNFEMQPLNSMQSNRNPRLAAGSKKP